MHVPEKFLHNIWGNQYLETNQLKTIDGQCIKVWSAGTRNKNAGPDFLDASISIEGYKKKGDVEIHSLSSDWIRHKHEKNPRYDTVILNVVFKNDTTLKNAPTLELFPFLNKDLHKILIHCIENEQYKLNALEMPCHKLISSVPTEYKADVITSLAKKRFANKGYHLAKNGRDNVEQAMIYGIFSAMGYSSNVSPMHSLFHRFSLIDIPPLDNLSCADKKDLLESTLFTLSGLIPQSSLNLTKETITYLKKLKRIYHKTFSDLNTSDIHPIPKAKWLFFRLRPASFPTIRLAGLATLLATYYKSGFISPAINIIESQISIRKKTQLLENLFMVNASGYWQSHYHFLRKANSPIKKLIGRTHASKIVINSLLPILKYFAMKNKRNSLEQKVIEIFENYPASAISSTSIKAIKAFLGQSTPIQGAFIEQGLLALKKEYCDKLHCLNCLIGTKLFEKNS